MRSPSPLDAVEIFRKSIFRDIRVAVPARVESFDASNATVDVQPLLKEEYTDESGDSVVESLPVVQSVPVMFPGAGNFRMTFPIEQGNTGLLIFTDRAMGQWLAKGGEVDPIDKSRHSLKDAVYIPGLNTLSGAWDVDASVITIGSDDGSAQFAALANLVDARIAALVTGINTILPGTVLPQASVASTTVKIKG